MPDRDRTIGYPCLPSQREPGPPALSPGGGPFPAASPDPQPRPAPSPPGHCYILNLESGPDSGNVLEWWARGNNSTVRLRDASRYPAGRVAADPAIFDNRTNSLAVPCELADRLAEPMVPGWRLREIKAVLGVGGMTGSRAASPDPDPRELRWSRQRPTEPGWWVIWDGLPDAAAGTCEVEPDSEDQGRLIVWGSPLLSDPAWDGYLWLGPLPEPPATPTGGDS